MTRLLLLFTMFLTLLHTGCEVDDLGNEKYSTKKDHENGFTLSYEISGSFSPLTRSYVALEEGEDKINSFYILFFENTSAGTGQFLDAIDAMEAYDAALNSTGTLHITFPENSVLNGYTDYKLLICTNIKEYSGISNVQDLISCCTGRMEKEVVRTLLEVSGVDPQDLTPEEEQIDNSNFMAKDNLPMSASLVKRADESDISIELIRAVSRFDIVSMAEGFELVSASIWNGYKTTTLWETVFTDFNAKPTERYYGVKTDKNEIIGSLYAFENFVSEPVQNDKETTCLILGFKRNGYSHIEYFRSNINVSERGHQIKRNNVYQTTIININGMGLPTERDAYENPENLVDFLMISPYKDWEFSAGGGSTDLITVASSGNWEATVTIDKHGYAFFSDGVEDDDEEGDEEGGNDNDGDGDTDKDPTGPQTITKGNGDSFVVILNTLSTLNKEATAKVKLSLVSNASVAVEFTITQRALDMNDVIVHTSHYRPGSLYHTSAAYGKNYAYNLQQNMRNGELFGPGGEVELSTEYVFIYGTGTAKRKVNSMANIYQLTQSGASTTMLNSAKSWMGEQKILFMIDRSGAANGLKRYESVFFNRSTSQCLYKVFDTGHTKSADDVRFFNPDILDESNKLVEYLLNGPFGEVNPNNIELYGRSTTNKGLSSWPSTFIPLIMVNRNGNNYCVFGIDPTNHFIFLGHPEIFGSPKTFANHANFDKEHYDNQVFLNNFIAWLSKSVSEPGFLDSFK